MMAVGVFSFLHYEILHLPQTQKE